MSRPVIRRRVACHEWGCNRIEKNNNYTEGCIPVSSIKDLVPYSLAYSARQLIVTIIVMEFVPVYLSRMYLARSILLAQGKRGE